MLSDKQESKLIGIVKRALIDKTEDSGALDTDISTN